MRTFIYLFFLLSFHQILGQEDVFARFVKEIKELSLDNERIKLELMKSMNKNAEMEKLLKNASKTSPEVSKKLAQEKTILEGKLAKASQTIDEQVKEKAGKEVKLSVYANNSQYVLDTPKDIAIAKVSQLRLDKLNLENGLNKSRTQVVETREALEELQKIFDEIVVNIPCPESFSRIDETCFRFGNREFTYDKAAAEGECAQLGGQLPVIRSREQFRKLKKLHGFPKHYEVGYYYLNGKYDGVEWRFTDNTTVSNNLWAENMQKHDQLQQNTLLFYTGNEYMSQGYYTESPTKMIKGRILCETGFITAKRVKS